MRIFPLLMLVAAPVFSVASTPEFKGSIERLDPSFDQLIAPEAKIEVLASGFNWSEGPVWYEGGLVFSDVPKNIAYKWKEGDTAAAVFLNPSGATKVLSDQGSNGLVLDAQKRLILCQGGDRCVARLEKDGKFTRLAQEFKGRHFNSPNDVIAHTNGTLIFTDPPYGVPKGGRQELDFHGVFVLTQRGQILPLIKDVRFPNGLAFSPDEKTLYIAVSDPDRPRIIAYDFNPNARTENGEPIPSVSHERLFFDVRPLLGPERIGLPDGLKVDTSGNVWSTGPGGVQVFTKEGRLLGSVLTGQPTGNCAFGGDGSDLYITANMFLLRIKTKAKGIGF
ncbi:MAG: Gluconolactonase [Verrucomicrobiaceae bacterium]|nr:Gluconolactonase [Verrucomicrobiaceae bacterium]